MIAATAAVNCLHNNGLIFRQNLALLATSGSTDIVEQ